MDLTDFNNENPNDQWVRYCELLWHNNDLNIWLDISRMKVNSSDIDQFKTKFNTAFKAIQADG